VSCLDDLSVGKEGGIEIPTIIVFGLIYPFYPVVFDLRD
jgi:hypothetical protein